MDRHQVLRRLDKAWLEFKESSAGLSDSQILEPGVQGRWSARDILAHVTTLDAFNARMTEEKRHLSLAEVRRQLDEVHGRLIDYIHRVPEELFTRETRFRRRLRLDAYAHYPKHARAIRTWRERHRLDASLVQHIFGTGTEQTPKQADAPCSSSTLSANSASAIPPPR